MKHVYVHLCRFNNTYSLDLILFVCIIHITLVVSHCLINNMYDYVKNQYDIVRDIAFSVIISVIIILVII